MKNENQRVYSPAMKVTETFEPVPCDSKGYVERTIAVSTPLVRCQNTVTKSTVIQSAHAVSIQSADISNETRLFLQGYNTSSRLADTRDAINNQLFSAIGQTSIPTQMTKVLASAQFSNPQVKQTFKISIQRYFRNTYQGKALVIAQNTCVSYTLADDETTDKKGKVVKIKNKEEEAAKALAAKQEKEAQELAAQQAVLQFDSVKQEAEQAKTTAATLIKKQNEHDKEIKSLEAKAKTATQLLTEENNNLRKQLERQKHETSTTIREYEALKTMILGKATRAELRAKVGGATVSNRRPEFTNHELNMIVNA